MGFPHSDITGSQITTHLPGAYRSSATSFIASFSLGIHRTPLISYQEINEPSICNTLLFCWPHLWGRTSLLDDHMISWIICLSIYAWVRDTLSDHIQTGFSFQRSFQFRQIKNRRSAVPRANKGASGYRCARWLKFTIIGRGDDYILEMIPVKKNLIKTVRDTRLGRTSDHFSLSQILWLS